MIEITVEQVNTRVPVIAGTGSNNTKKLSLTRHGPKAARTGLS